MAEETQSPGDAEATESAPGQEPTANEVVASDATAASVVAAEEAPAEETPAADATPSASYGSVGPPAPHLSPVEAEFRPVEGVTTPEREVDGYEYEIMYIVDPGCEKEAIQEVADKARQIIEHGEGALDNVRTSQLRRLAFEIKGKRDGTYVVLNLRSKPAVTRELDRLFKLDERVLRHMILRTDSEGRA